MLKIKSEYSNEYLNELCIFLIFNFLKKYKNKSTFENLLFIFGHFLYVTILRNLRHNN
jgi:hypothetical protein